MYVMIGTSASLLLLLSFRSSDPRR
eukprot:SAG22_NODE_20262_length_267_cov_0.613095_1_plen_24_part_01